MATEHAHDNGVSNDLYDDEAVHSAQLTDRQKQQLSEFRNSISDSLKPGQDDQFLLRWLRARNFDLKKSEDMYRKSMAWRAKYRVDGLLDHWKPPKALKVYFPGGWLGFDKEGRPIFIEPIGKVDMKGITLSSHKIDVILKNVWEVERGQKLMEEQSAKLGKRIDKVIFISDMEGFTMAQLLAPGMDTLLKVMATVEANYPECLGQAYVINAPRIWSLVFNICKPFLSEHTKKKIVLLGKDWRSKLLENIDADQLPVHWGGQRMGASGDPYCQDIVCMGGKVPTRYYLNEQELIDPAKLTFRIVEPGDQFHIELLVTEINTAIKWFFKADKDIGFEISFKDPNTQQLIRQMRIDRSPCNVVPEIGTFVCERMGTYMVLFDNRYSWFNAKKLSYCIEMAQAEQMLSSQQADYEVESSEMNSNYVHGLPEHSEPTAGEDDGWQGDLL